MGFDLIFNLSGILFIFVFGFIIFTIAKQLGEWDKNNHSPIMSAEATVMGKRTKFDQHPVAGADTIVHHQQTTTYFVTFELNSKERLEFKVPGREYGLLAEQDRGMLTYQGSRFKRFERILAA